MNLLLEKLAISIEHLKCLDEVFYDNHEEYRRIEEILTTSPFSEVYQQISKELYAGGKQMQGNNKMHRQMILNDVVEYIFSGRAYYHAATSDDNLKNFLKLIMYCVNQLLIYDSITVDPNIRSRYIERLEARIPRETLYEKNGDEELAQALRGSNIIIRQQGWADYDTFVDSLLPKTLGCPKELVVFAELIRSRQGIIIPLLLTQRIFGDGTPIAPPDFLILKRNKEIFGVELGYTKEEQSREFTIRTSIPTFAVDLEHNLHNRCPICGHMILYCDKVINLYAEGTLRDNLVSGKFLCGDCEHLDNGQCKYANYYGHNVIGQQFYGIPDDGGWKHYHARCVRNLNYTYRRETIPIINEIGTFFSQIPQIQGIENL